jgi:ATP-dependent Clp protease adapter protein ClpS
MEKADIEVQEEKQIETVTVTFLGSRVILFNDDIHTFDEVIVQLIKATGCSFDKAIELTNEVDKMGKASVFEGEMPDCLRVSSILEEIALHTQIEVD